jgi:hypothetical protein
MAPLVPPPPKACHGKLGGVPTDPPIPPAFIPAQVINTLGARMASLRVGKVIRLHWGGPSLRFPFAARLGEIPQIFLLRRIHREHRAFVPLKPLDVAVAEQKLRVPIRMTRPFLRFAVRLQTLAQDLQEPIDCTLTDRMSLLAQRRRQLGGTLARPPQ